MFVKFEAGWYSGRTEGRKRLPGGLPRSALICENCPMSLTDGPGGEPLVSSGLRGGPYRPRASPPIGAGMPPDLSSFPPPLGLLAPVLRTIGFWTVGYVLLSLSLALIWIALVSMGRSYSRRAWSATGGTEPLRVRLGAGFGRWQGENEDVWRELEYLERRLNASGYREDTVRASKLESSSSPRAESQLESDFSPDTTATPPA
jgi:hypothetical protein